MDEAIAVAGRPAVGTRLAFLLQSQSGAIVDAGRNLDFASDVLLDVARAAATAARLADHLAVTVAGGAGGLQREDAALLDHAAVAAAVAARLGLRAGLGARAAARFAGGMTRETNRLHRAVGGLHQVQRDFAA